MFSTRDGVGKEFSNSIKVLQYVAMQLLLIWLESNTTIPHHNDGFQNRFVLFLVQLIVLGSL